MFEAKAKDVFEGSDGELTKAYYRELESWGIIGTIAMNLFRAQKCSTRAKVYRGGRNGTSFRQSAYDRKNWSMNNLCDVLISRADECGIEFGWKQDHGTAGYNWVLYVDLPTGQVSFHSPSRGRGPDYRRDWDRSGGSEARILAFCDSIVLAGEPRAVNPIGR